MTHERPEMEVGDYRVIWEDFSGHPTDGIPPEDISEVKVFLRDSLQWIESSEKFLKPIQDEINKSEKYDIVCVSISHKMNPFTALATYHLRIRSKMLMLLECERDIVKHSEGRESGWVERGSYEVVGRLEPKDPGLSGRAR